MASSPVTAPAPKLPSPPPHDSSPPPNSSPPPILQQADSSQPPVEAATSPPPPPESPPPPPPDKAKSPPPDDSKSPPAPESKSPPPPPLPTPTPPAATLTPPPTTTSPPPVITPPPPSSPPPPALAPPTAITQPPPLPTSSPPPPQTSQNPVLILSPPLPFITPPSSVVFPPPQLPTIPTPSSPGAFLPPPNAPPTHRTPSPRTPSSSSNDGSSSSSSHNDLVADRLPLIIGITAGVGLLFLTIIVLVVVCSSKKKKKGTPMNNQLQYYGNPPPQGSKGAMYYDNSNGQHPNWYNNNPQMMDYQGNKIGPPQGLVVPPPGAAWGSPQPITSSSEMGSNLSDPPQHMLPASPNGGISVNKSSFSYDELAAATNGFSQANLIGQGGFGYVHKGVLPNDKVVAVKSLKSGSGQGEREFQAEVEIISRVHHRHLVSLVGYCSAGGQRMLVYEFVPNKTLEYHLHGKGCPTMEWSKRLKIAMGAAKGLAYLHEDCHPRIIHRDIKAANILIDNNFEAMVADFGLAKLSSDIYTHVSTRIMGTFGYLAPEYASSGKLTEKSDVFSFGVMLLELITGRRPVDTTNTYMEDSLVDWARPILTHPGGDYHELVDSRLEGNYDISEMSCMVACASASIRHSARRRPKMSQIVRALEGDVSLEMLNEGGVKPGQSSAFTTSTSTEYEAGSYNANMQKFRKMALGSTNQQEMGSTEYSGLTSTYGLNPSSSSDSSSGEVNQIPTRRPQY